MSIEMISKWPPMWPPNMPGRGELGRITQRESRSPQLPHGRFRIQIGLYPRDRWGVGLRDKCEILFVVLDLAHIAAIQARLVGNARSARGRAARRVRIPVPRCRSRAAYIESSSGCTWFSARPSSRAPMRPAISSSPMHGLRDIGRGLPFHVVSAPRAVRPYRTKVRGCPHWASSLN